MARVYGDKQIIKTLSTIGRSPGQVLDAACVASLEPIRQQTADNARLLRQPGSPRGGHLDQGVVIAKVQSRGRNFREFWTTFRGRARKLAHLVEFGTAPHWQPRRMRMHPGARPKPFARPAYEERKNEAVQIFGQRMWAGIVTSIRGVTK